MQRKSMGTFVIFSMLILTGCWDRVELNDRAIVLGWGMDIMDNGKYRGSGQFVIPSKLGSAQDGGNSQGKPFFVETGIGTNILEASRDLQWKLSRIMFGGHRRAVYFGEKLARHGIREVIDEYSRNPSVRMRTDMFVIKNGEALNLLKIPYPFERIPSIATVKMHQIIGVDTSLTLRDFLMEAKSDSGSPVLPAIEIPKKQKQSEVKWKLTSTAIFNRKSQLVGYISNEDGVLRRWIRGELKYDLITIPFAKNQNITIEINQLKRKIQPVIKQGKVKINVILGGKGIVRENNTPLNVTDPKKFLHVQQEVNKVMEQRVLHVIQLVQTRYNADIFGFGEAVHRKYPYKWKTAKKDWVTNFKTVDVSVKVNLTIERFGLTGPSSLMKENKK